MVPTEGGKTDHNSRSSLLILGEKLHDSLFLFAIKKGNVWSLPLHSVHWVWSFDSKSGLDSNLNIRLGFRVGSRNPSAGLGSG